jgi:hypothetical protein
VDMNMHLIRGAGLLAALFALAASAPAARTR